MSRTSRVTLALLAGVGVVVGSAHAEQVVRTRDTGTAPGARIVSAGNRVFPAGIAGTTGTALEQVDEIVTRVHETLGLRGLGIGNMLQHTIYLKDGAAQPIAAIQRFHAQATKLAPSLKERPSVGAIVRVPELPSPGALVMVDVVAGAPANGGATDDWTRIRFTFGPQDIAETLRIGSVVFTAGLEARDFEHGTLAPGLPAQIDMIVSKLNTAATKAGLSIGNMVSHNLYVKVGTNPGEVIQLLHPALRRYTQDLGANPPVGAIVVVDGMANPGFLLEMDAILSTDPPARRTRVPFTEVKMDVARSVTADGLVFLSSMPGVDFEKQSATPADVFAQIDIAVKNVDHTLRKSGLSIADMVKHKIYLRKGAADPDSVRAAFYKAVARYAPSFAKNPSAETFVIVEGLASDQRLFEISAIAARR